MDWYIRVVRALTAGWDSWTLRPLVRTPLGTPENQELNSRDLDRTEKVRKHVAGPEGLGDDVWPLK